MGSTPCFCSRWLDELVLNGERRSPKVDVEPGAPDGDSLVLVEVGVGRHVVVLVPYVALDRAQVDKTCLLHRGAIHRVTGGHQIDVDVRAVGGGKVCKAEDALAVGKLKNRGRAGGLVRPVVKVARFQVSRLRRHSRGCCREALAYRLVEKESLGTERIPGDSA